MKSYICFLALLVACLSAAENVTGFEDLSYMVTISVNEDGTAHVDEDVFLIVYPNAIELYKNSLKSTRLTIGDWQRTTGSKNLRYHVLGGDVSPRNTRIFPKPLTRFEFVDKAIATITIEYDTSAPLFIKEEIGPRKIKYTLKDEALSFENAPEGQVLPENSVLIINVLPGSSVDLKKTFPRPTKPVKSTNNETMYVWNATGGAIPITPFDFSFVKEESIDKEISEFFTDLQKRVAGLIFSNYGALVILIISFMGLLMFVLKQTKAI